MGFFAGVLEVKPAGITLHTIALNGAWKTQRLERPVKKFFMRFKKTSI
jgi:hypothetical protein